jgi:hypothetical protein
LGGNNKNGKERDRCPTLLVYRNHVHDLGRECCG